MRFECGRDTTRHTTLGATLLGEGSTDNTIGATVCPATMLKLDESVRKAVMINS